MGSEESKEGGKKRGWVFACLILVIAIGCGVAVGWWVLGNVNARLSLANQPATVVVPQPMPVKAKILDKLDILINGSIKTKVPIDQTIRVPIRNNLNVMVTLDHKVPIKMNVPVHAEIPLHKVIHLDSKVTVSVLGVPVTLPVRGDVPITTTVPLNIVIPVDQQVQMKFTAPARVKILSTLKVPLKTQIATTIALYSEMHIPVKSDLHANVSILKPVHAVIKHANLKLPLHTLRLGLGNGAQAPVLSAASKAQPAPVSSSAPPATPGSAAADATDTSH